MSHYTVLVIGEDPEEQLAPYDENLEVEPYRVYMTDDEARAFERVYGLLLTSDLDAVLEWLRDWWGTGAVGYDADRDEYYHESTYNPQSRWDWYQLGGRWRGFFKLRRGARAGTQVGGSVTFGNEKMHPNGADACRKGDVDVEGMRDAAGRTAGERWDLYASLTEGMPDAEPWDDVLARHLEGVDEGDADARKRAAAAAREEYGAQPRVMALRERSAMESLGFMVSPEDFLPSREQEVERARRRTLMPYAWLKDGVWRAPGRMGSWGMSTDKEEDRDLAEREFEAMFDALDDDTLLSLYDCHI